MRHISQLNRKRRFTRNIQSVLKQAKPSDYSEGAAWYRNARLFSYRVSRQYGVSLRKVCAMLAALSPRNKWARNQSDCENLIACLVGRTNEFPKCGTYGAMVRKAVKIFHSKDDSTDTMLTLLNGQKITAFFLNIYDCNSQRVTVDTWIQLISLGKYIETVKRPVLTKNDYKLIEESIREVASTKKIAPPVLQAVLWVSFKRMTESKDFN